jgi:uncharacterized membrane protein
VAATSGGLRSDSSPRREKYRKRWNAIHFTGFMSLVGHAQSLGAESDGACSVKQLVQQILRATPWTILFMLAGFMTFLMMVAMVGSVRDGWQLRDIGGLIPVVVFLVPGFISARKLQRQWLVARSGNSAVNGTRPWIRLLISFVLGSHVIYFALLGIGYMAPERLDSSAQPQVARPERTIETNVDRLPRGEWTEDAFDEESVEQLRERVHANVLENIQRDLERAGHETTTTAIGLHSEGEVTEFNGRGLLVVTYGAPTLMRGVLAFGIVGDEAVALTCYSEGVGSVSLMRLRPCRDRLRELFPPRG